MRRMVYEVAIIGYGPAGITAAIYTARKKLNTMLVGETPGGEVLNSGVIENWPGASLTDGVTLAQQMIKHLQEHRQDIEIIPGKITRISKQDKIFLLAHQDGKTYKAETVIYATGRHPRTLDVPGERELRNSGVSYCATCDAPLFTDKAVAVVGGGNTGVEAVIMLQNIAKKIYLLHIGKQLKADPVLIENINGHHKTNILLQAKTIKIGGDKFVEGLEYEDLRTGKVQTLAVDGVFVTIGAEPNTEPVRDLVKLDEWGAIVADRYGATDQPGFFAAGDVTNIRDAQIIVAAGHGCSAALSAGDYLVRNRGRE